MKKMILMASLLLGLGLASVATAKPVKVVLKDGSIVNGDMLGQDAGVLTLETKDGKSKDISLRNIKKIFDADGNSIALDSLSGSSAASQASVAKEDAMPTGDDDSALVEPARHKARRVARQGGRNGMKIAGAIMGYTGLGVFLVGDLIYFTGVGEANDATSTYYPNQDYYGDLYEIDGKWYTYSQYIAYNEAQGVETTGVVIAVVGAAVCITGFILEASAHGPRVNDDGALLDIKDGKLAWGMPDINALPGRTTTTLLTAQF